MSISMQHRANEIAKELVGAVITEALHDDTGQGSFGFRVRTGRGVILEVWVDRDAEGNGPGWLTIEK